MVIIIGSTKWFSFKMHIIRILSSTLLIGMHNNKQKNKNQYQNQNHGHTFLMLCEMSKIGTKCTEASRPYIHSVHDCLCDAWINCGAAVFFAYASSNMPSRNYHIINRCDHLVSLCLHNNSKTIDNVVWRTTEHNKQTTVYNAWWQMNLHVNNVMCIHLIFNAIKFRAVEFIHANFLLCGITVP